MRLLPKSSGLRGVALLSGGSLLGSVMAFVASLALARLYTPQAHGHLAIVSAYAVVITPIVSGRFDAAIPIPKRDRDSFRLLQLGFVWATCCTLVFLGLVFFLDRLLAVSEGPVTLPHFIWAAPVFALLSAYLALANQFSVRQRLYRVVSLRNIFYPGATAGAQVGLGLTSPVSTSLILGTIVGRAITLLVFVREYLLFRVALRADESSPSYRSLVRRFSRFPTIMTISSIVNALGLQMPVLLLEHWYGTDSAGFFSMYQRTVAIPISLVGAAIGQVYLSEMSRAMRESNGQARRIFATSTKVLGTAGILIAAALFFAGPDLFAIVFGDAWRPSGNIGRAMAVSFAVQIVAAPLAQALVVYERYWTQLSWDIGRLVLVITALGLAFQMGLGFIQACWILGVATAVSYIASWFLAKRTVSHGHLSAGDAGSRMDRSCQGDIPRSRRDG